jgi:hypothetical protein
MSTAKRATTTAVLAIYGARRRPLKIGIHADIAAALDGAITPSELGVALRFYTDNEGYLRALRGVPRIGLDGEPAGVVTESEAQHAKALLIARRQKKPAAVTGPHAAVPPAQQPPTVKRLTLTDLKAAARQAFSARRRAMSSGQRKKHVPLKVRGGDWEWVYRDTRRLAGIVQRVNDQWRGIKVGPDGRDREIANERSPLSGRAALDVVAEIERKRR